MRPMPWLQHGQRRDIRIQFAPLSNGSTYQVLRVRDKRQRQHAVVQRSPDGRANTLPVGVRRQPRWKGALDDTDVEVFSDEFSYRMCCSVSNHFSTRANQTADSLHGGGQPSFVIPEKPDEWAGRSDLEGDCQRSSTAVEDHPI